MIHVAVWKTRGLEIGKRGSRRTSQEAAVQAGWQCSELARWLWRQGEVNKYKTQERQKLLITCVCVAKEKSIANDSYISA